MTELYRKSAEFEQDAEQIATQLARRPIAIDTNPGVPSAARRLAEAPPLPRRRK
jgi:hypothetical protein